MLAIIDDKYLFMKDDLEMRAAKAGFKEVHLFSPWLESGPGVPRKPEKIWKAITIEILEALQKEAGLEPVTMEKLRFPFLDLVDGLIGNELTKRIPPQGILVFVR